MAHRPFSHRDSQIDPFNAGEPIMPWDGPETAHVECDLDDEAGYDAPSPDRSARQQAREQKREQEAARRAAKRQGPSAETGAASAGADPQSPEGGAPKKRGRGCLLVILALVAIRLLGSLVSCAGDAVDAIFAAGDNALDGVTTALGEDDADEASAYDDLTDDELRCAELVEERLSGLIDDEAAHQLVVGELTECLEDYTGHSPAELGIDADGFADWYLGTFWYEIDSAYCWDDGTATVYFSYMEADYTATYDFAESVAAHLEEQGVEAGDALTAEQLESVQALYKSYLDEMDTETDSIEYVDLAQDDDAWAIDEESYETALEWMMDIY